MITARQAMSRPDTVRVLLTLLEAYDNDEAVTHFDLTPDQGTVYRLHRCAPQLVTYAEASQFSRDPDPFPRWRLTHEGLKLARNVRLIRIREQLGGAA